MFKIKNIYKNFLRLALSISVIIISSHANSAGGYLSFTPRSYVSNYFDEINFFFRMNKNPGPQAFAYYAHNFYISSSVGSPNIGGYMGLQSSAYPHNKSTYALATIWPNTGQVISLKAGPYATCTEQASSAEGHIATCTITAENPLTAEIIDGTTYKLYSKIIKTTGVSKIYRFGIVNLLNGNDTILGDMELKNSNGISSYGLSHFLEYFSTNGAHCDQIPFTSYTEYAPVGYFNNNTYYFNVTENPDGKYEPCDNTVNYSNDASTASVDFSIKTKQPIKNR